MLIKLIRAAGGTVQRDVKGPDGNGGRQDDRERREAVLPSAPPRLAPMCRMPPPELQPPGLHCAGPA